MQHADRAAKIAASILSFRKARRDVLPADLFSEPSWDLLLSLFVADAEGDRLTARAVAEWSDVPLSVMSRWLKYLSRIGLVVGDGDGDLDDGLTLSATGFQAIETLMTRANDLHSMMSSAPLAGPSL